MKSVQIGLLYALVSVVFATGYGGGGGGGGSGGYESDYGMDSCSWTNF